MKKILLLVLAMLLVGCSSKSNNQEPVDKKIDEQSEEVTLENLKKVISSLEFDQGNGYKCEAYDIRKNEASTMDNEYDNTYIYETYRNKDETISVAYRFSGSNHIFTNVTVYDSRDKESYDYGELSTENVIWLFPSEYWYKISDNNSYIENFQSQILNKVEKAEKLIREKDKIVIETNEEDSNMNMKFEYAIDEQQIQMITITFNEDGKEISCYQYTPIDNGMKRAEEISLLVQNAAFKLNLEEIPFNELLNQEDAMKGVLDQINNLDFSIAQEVNIYERNIEEKTNVVTNCREYNSLNRIEYCFNYDENDELSRLMVNYDCEGENPVIIERKKSDNYKANKFETSGYMKVVSIMEPLYGINSDLKVENKNDNIQITGKTSKGYVSILYIVENGKIVEMREDLYSDSDMKQLKQSYYLSTKVPTWEYFISQYKLVETMDIKEIKKLDYFKAGL